nr:hypothetical protein [uncultured archaeon]AQS33744.1 hypothetical protein [uncultured archaeon]
MIRVAINGFGRIGRQVLQAGIHDSHIEWVAINDLTDTNTLAHLLKYDSVHGRSRYSVEAKPDGIVVNGKFIKVFAEKDPEKLPWKDLGIDIVVESTGFFLTKEGAEKHLKAGAKKVLLSADAKDDSIKTIIKGVNEHTYDKSTDHIVSNASCTSNCSAPMVKVLSDNFGIENAFFNTVHAVTSTQKLHDAPDANLRNARAAFVNIIPHKSGAAVAVPLTVPEVKGILDGMAIRIPVLDGSITILTALLKKQTTVKEINQLFKNVSEHHLKGVLEYSEEKLVSTDIIHNPHSCILDSEFTKVSGKLVQILGWYDNEWGYSNRMVDVIKIL